MQYVEGVRRIYTPSPLLFENGIRFKNIFYSFGWNRDHNLLQYIGSEKMVLSRFYLLLQYIWSAIYISLWTGCICQECSVIFVYNVDSGVTIVRNPHITFYPQIMF